MPSHQFRTSAEQHAGSLRNYRGLMLTGLLIAAGNNTVAAQQNPNAQPSSIPSNPTYAQYSPTPPQYTPPQVQYRSTPSQYPSSQDQYRPATPQIPSSYDDTPSDVWFPPRSATTTPTNQTSYIAGGRNTADEASFWGMTLDLLLVRPLGLVATTAGSLGFVLSLPFTLTAGNTGDAAETLVKAPARLTFTRPLGTSWDEPRGNR